MSQVWCVVSMVKVGIPFGINSSNVDFAGMSSATYVEIANTTAAVMLNRFSGYEPSAFVKHPSLYSVISFVGRHEFFVHCGRGDDIRTYKFKLFGDEGAINYETNEFIRMKDYVSPYDILREMLDVGKSLSCTPGVISNLSLFCFVLNCDFDRMYDWASQTGVLNYVFIRNNYPARFDICDLVEKVDTVDVSSISSLYTAVSRLERKLSDKEVLS